MLRLTTLLALSLSVLAASCGSRDPREPELKVDQAFEQVHAFKSSVAAEAGIDAVPLRSLQGGAVGDIWTYCPVDHSVFARSGSVLPDGFDIDAEGEDTRLFQVDSIHSNLTWEREWGVDVDAGIEFLNVALKAAYGFQAVDRMELKLSLVEASLLQLREPIGLVEDFYLTDGALRGDAVVTGVVRGRLRLEYTAFSGSGQEFELSASALSEAINGLPGVDAGYTTSNQGEVSIITESPESGSAIAVVYYSVPDGQVDRPWVDDQLFQFCEDREGEWEERGFLVRNPVTEELLAIFRFQQQTVETNGVEEDNWYLIIENIDPEDRAITFSYDAEIWSDLGFFQFGTAGLVDSLLPDRAVSKGLVSHSGMDIRFAVLEVDVDDIEYNDHLVWDDVRKNVFYSPDGSNSLRWEFVQTSFYNHSVSEENLVRRYVELYVENISNQAAVGACLHFDAEAHSLLEPGMLLWSHEDVLLEVPAVGDRVYVSHAYEGPIHIEAVEPSVQAGLCN